jgi:7-carboxy-7-deazaguanine synthase
VVDSLRLTEIFYSLQGESTTVGLPTVFIRLTGCPLRCHYCDTAYAFHGGEKIRIAEIIQQVEAYGADYVTVTGGEPLAQPACLSLMSQLADHGYRVSIETSGALDISGIDPRVVKVMDLKTPSSGESSKNRYQNLEFLQAADELKFVIGTEEDYQWAKQLLLDYALTKRCQVLFSPVAEQLSPLWLAEKILQDRLTVRFQIQLHKYLWGNAQGK